MISLRALVRTLVAVFALSVCLPATAQASHQLGGSMRWERDPSLNSTTNGRYKVHVELVFRWNYPYFSSGPMPALGTALTEEDGPFHFSYGPGPNDFVELPLTVQAVSADGNWLVASRDVTLTLPLASLPTTFAFEDCCRRSDLADGNGEQAFRLETVITNTGGASRSPSSSTAPRIYGHVGQPIDFRLPRIDANNLTSRFRLATSTESGLITTAPSGFTLSADGRVSWTPTVQGIYTVQVAVDNVSGAKSPLDVTFEISAPGPQLSFAAGVCGATIESYVGLQTVVPVLVTSPVANDPVSISFTPLPAGVTTLSRSSGLDLNWFPDFGHSSGSVCLSARSASGLSNSGNCCVDLTIGSSELPENCSSGMLPFAPFTRAGVIPTSFEVGVPASIELQMRTPCDTEITVGGHANLFEARLSLAKDTVPVNVVDLGTGRYRLDFTPPYASHTWMLEVTFQNLYALGTYLNVQPHSGLVCVQASDCGIGYCASGVCAIDFEPPSISLAGLPTLTRSETLTIEGIANDNGQLYTAELILNGFRDQNDILLLLGSTAVVNFGPHALNAGENTVFIRLRDKSNNVLETTQIVTRDSIAPSVRFVAPTLGQAIGNAWIDTTLEVTDATATSVRVNGGAPLLVNGSALISTTVPVLASGQFELSAIATDAAGNVTNVRRSVLVDLTAPDVSLNVANGARYAALSANLLPLTVMVSSVSATSVTTPGSSFSLERGGGFVSTLVPLVEGLNSLVISATDEIGRRSQVSRSVVYDLTPPSGVILTPTAGSFSRGVVELTASFRDNLTGVASASFRVDAGSDIVPALDGASALATFDTTTLSNGQHTLTLTLNDGVGNRRALSTAFGVDNLAPTVTLLTPPGVVHGSIELQVQAVDTTSGIASLAVIANGAIIASCEGATTCSGRLDTTMLADGPFLVAARALDRAGNIAQSADTTLTAQNAVPAHFLVSPLDGAVVRASTLPLKLVVPAAQFASGECFLEGVSLGVFSNPTFSKSVSLANVLDGPAALRCVVRAPGGSTATEAVTVNVDRWSIAIKPSKLDLRPHRGCGSDDLEVVVEGPNAEILLPLGPRRLSLVVPGGAPLRVEAGQAVGRSGKVRLVFDRNGLVSSIRAGISGKQIDPRRPILVSLLSGSRLIGSDTLTVTE